MKGEFREHIDNKIILAKLIDYYCYVLDSNYCCGHLQVATCSIMTSSTPRADIYLACVDRRQANNEVAGVIKRQGQQGVVSPCSFQWVAELNRK